MNRHPNKLFSTPRFDVLHVAEGERDYFYVSKPDSAIAVVTDAYDQVALIRARRMNVEGDSWELPGGRVEVGEHPASAIVREVQEELSLSIGGASVTAMGSTLPLPSVTTERAHIFGIKIASDLRKIEGERDGNHEGIREVRVVPISRVFKMLMQGEVTCAVDAYALFLVLGSEGVKFND